MSERERTGEQFDKNTGETPHVNGWTVGNTENDLGSSIESRLNVRVNCNAKVTAMGRENDR